MKHFFSVSLRKTREGKLEEVEYCAETGEGAMFDAQADGYFPENVRTLRSAPFSTDVPENTEIDLKRYIKDLVHFSDALMEPSVQDLEATLRDSGIPEHRLNDEVRDEMRNYDIKRSSDIFKFGESEEEVISNLRSYVLRNRLVQDYNKDLVAAIKDLTGLDSPNELLIRCYDVLNLYSRNIEEGGIIPFEVTAKRKTDSEYRVLEYLALTPEGAKGDAEIDGFIVSKVETSPVIDTDY